MGTPDDQTPGTANPGSMRLDKWLWHARFFKTRGLATKIVAAGKVRVDGTPVSKPSRSIAPGVVLTFPQGDRVRVVRVTVLGERRGPAPEAQGLYEDLTPETPKPKDNIPTAPRIEGKGRPSRKERQNRQALLRDIESS